MNQGETGIYIYMTAAALKAMGVMLYVLILTNSSYTLNQILWVKSPAHLGKIYILSFTKDSKKDENAAHN